MSFDFFDAGTLMMAPQPLIPGFGALSIPESAPLNDAWLEPTGFDVVALVNDLDARAPEAPFEFKFLLDNALQSTPPPPQVDDGPDEDDEIFVDGVRLRSPTDDGGAGGGGGGGGLGEWGSDTASIEAGSDALPAAEPLLTPCVETTFATPGVSLTDVNRAALAASNVIAGLEMNDSMEFSSIIFFHNGMVGFTEPYTDLLEDDVNLLGGIGNVPTGAVILGIVHNHPDKNDVDDRSPTSIDWAGFDRIQSLSASGDLPRGITADTNKLFYILTDQDNKTRVYDKTDKNSERASCPLQ